MAPSLHALPVMTDVIKTLNELIQLDFDASRTYEQAIERVQDPMIREDLELFRADHERHIVELTSAVEDLGGEVEEVSRDVKGVLLEGVTRLRSATGTLGALRAMRLNEKLSNRAYGHAADKDLPAAAHEIITRGLEDERRHLAAIEAHIDRYGLRDLEEERPSAHL
jgi:uncharacterized protein (TIGR02284 family)